VSSTVGRLGDDDFVVLLTGDVTIDAADRLARTILDALAEPVEVADEVLQVRARAGVATLDEVSGSMPGPTDLLQRADLAVHHAEWAGGAVVRYDDALARRI